MNENASPKTLIEAVALYSNPDVAHAAMTRFRWPNGVTCPRCGSQDHYFIASRRVWECKSCKRQFSVKLGSIMEDSALGINKWLACMWLIANAKNSISSHEIARSLGVTQKSAWFMAHRIRHAMKAGTLEKLEGTVEVDETYIGAKANRMNKAARKRWEEKKEADPSTGGKTAVYTAVERDGRAIARRIPDASKHTIRRAIDKTVEPGATIYTDESSVYDGLDGYEHDAVNHSEGEHVRGEVHTQNADNYHSLFKRCVRGTWVNISPQHTNRYLVEQDFRYNEREHKDGERAAKVAGSVAGKRLTYRGLTAKRVGRGPQKGFDWRKEKQD